jgi:hypothetical protein
MYLESDAVTTVTCIVIVAILAFHGMITISMHREQLLLVAKIIYSYVILDTQNRCSTFLFPALFVLTIRVHEPLIRVCSLWQPGSRIEFHGHDIVLTQVIDALEGIWEIYPVYLAPIRG